MTEIDIQQIRDAAAPLVAVAKDLWGETQYTYYAVPVAWRSGRGSRRGEHMRPITGLERYETTKDKWETGKDESRQNRTAAFMGELKSGYTDYTRSVTKTGWREKLIELLKDEKL